MKERFARSSRGSILVITVWCLSVLAVFSVSLASSVKEKAAFAKIINTPDSLYSIAYSGIEQARGLIREEEETPVYSTFLDRWVNNPSVFRQVSLGDGHFTVSRSVSVGEGSTGSAEWFGLEDEEGKININTADAQTLTRVLKIAAKLDSDQAEELAFAMVDWRDQDSNYSHPEYGAEDKDYEGLKKPYFSKDAPYQALDELLLVKGINRDIFDRIRGFISVYGSGAVDVNTASKEVLTMLGFNQRLVDKILFYRQGPDGLDGTADDRFFVQGASIASDLDKIILLDFAEKTALENAAAGAKLDVVSNFFLVKSRAVNLAGASVGAEAVIDRKGKVMYSRFSRVQWPS